MACKSIGIEKGKEKREKKEEGVFSYKMLRLFR